MRVTVTLGDSLYVLSSEALRAEDAIRIRMLPGVYDIESVRYENGELGYITGHHLAESSPVDEDALDELEAAEEFPCGDFLLLKDIPIVEDDLDDEITSRIVQSVDPFIMRFAFGEAPQVPALNLVRLLVERDRWGRSTAFALVHLTSVWWSRRVKP